MAAAKPMKRLFVTLSDLFPGLQQAAIVSQGKLGLIAVKLKHKFEKKSTCFDIIFKAIDF